MHLFWLSSRGRVGGVEGQCGLLCNYKALMFRFWILGLGFGICWYCGCFFYFKGKKKKGNHYIEVWRTLLYISWQLSCDWHALNLKRMIRAWLSRSVFLSSARLLTPLAAFQRWRVSLRDFIDFSDFVYFLFFSLILVLLAWAVPNIPVYTT